MCIGTVRLLFVSFAHAPLPHVPSPNLCTLCHYQHQRTPIEVFLAADSTTSTDSYKSPICAPVGCTPLLKPAQKSSARSATWHLSACACLGWADAHASHTLDKVRQGGRHSPSKCCASPNSPSSTARAGAAQPSCSSHLRDEMSTDISE